MNEPIRITVTLSPETLSAIEAMLLSALARPARRPPREPVLLSQRPPYDSAITILDVAPALMGRASITIRQLADALGVPPERQTRALATGLGRELRECGWSPTQRGGGGIRERVYRPTGSPALDKDGLPL